MPPKQKITKEMVLKAAFEIFRNEGLDAVTARAIASALKVSTQPVYSAFPSMEDLKGELLQMAKSRFGQALMSGKDTSDVFLNMGLGYVRFAMDEKHLFEALAQSEVKQGGGFADLGQEISAYFENDQRYSFFDRDEMKEMLLKMEIFTLGLATYCKEGYLEDASDERIFRLLAETGEAVVRWSVAKKEGEFNEDSCAERQFKP